jgi:hypothetical protein
MNFRERVIRTVQFQPVDALPFEQEYGLMPGVLEDWHAEGLPANVNSEAEILRHFGFPPRPRGLPASTWFRPGFDERVIEDTDRHQIAIDGMGRRTKLVKGYATIALPMEYPVSDAASWQDYKRRLVFNANRIGPDLEKVAALNVAEGSLNAVMTKGFYWFPRDLMGDEALCVAYYEQPELVADILETWCGLLEQVLSAALARVALDRVHLDEDMAYKNGSIIGKAIFDRFMKPYYLRIRRLVEKHRVPVFSVDTDGNVDDLTTWFADCGVTMIGPNEVQAGNDIRERRKRFGKKMAFFGGLEKMRLPEGRAAIEEMLSSTVPFMKETGGGWVIGLDHRIVRGTRLADYRFFVERTREMCAY